MPHPANLRLLAPPLAAAACIQACAGMWGVAMAYALVAMTFGVVGWGGEEVG